MQKYTCNFLRENEIFFDRQKKDSYLLKIVYLFDIVRVHRTRSLTREKLSNFMQIYLHTSIATAQNKNSSTQTFFICFTHPVSFFDNSFTRKISRACRKNDFSTNNAYFYSNIVNLLRITVPSLKLKEAETEKMIMSHVKIFTTNNHEMIVLLMKTA